MASNTRWGFQDCHYYSRLVCSINRLQCSAHAAGWVSFMRVWWRHREEALGEQRGLLRQPQLLRLGLGLVCSANRAQHYAGLPSAAAKGLRINCISLSLHHTGWTVRTLLSFCEAGILGLKAKWGITDSFSLLAQKVQNIHTVNRAKRSQQSKVLFVCRYVEESVTDDRGMAAFL